MQTHHLAWLSAHPDRTEQWLRERIADGFDVHHLDGNRDNNSKDNLILLEHVDHMRVHQAEHLAIPRLELTRKINARPWRMIYQNPIGPSPHWRSKGCVPVKMRQEWWDQWGDKVRATGRKNGLNKRGVTRLNGLYKSEITANHWN